MNWREFNNQPLLGFFKVNGIKILFSCPYTSQQNRKVKRTTQTINNILWTSLIQSFVPLQFWVDTLLSVVHTFNLLPILTLKYQTPFEILSPPPYTLIYVCLNVFVTLRQHPLLFTNLHITHLYVFILFPPLIIMDTNVLICSNIRYLFYAMLH